jgi:hypothetical protein
MNMTKLLITAAMLGWGSGIAVAQESPLAPVNKPSPTAKGNKPTDFPLAKMNKRADCEPPLAQVYRPTECEPPLAQRPK